MPHRCFEKVLWMFAGAFCLQCLESLEFPVTGRLGADRTLQLLAAKKETTSELGLLEARKGNF